LRRLVRERVAAGEDQATVIRFVHERYGDFVLLRPPVTAATMLLWATPVLALGGGIAVIMFRRRRALAEAAALSPEEAKRLAELDRGAA
jgi:cytochrome c-type biogenesis protein CcmH